MSQTSASAYQQTLRQARDSCSTPFDTLPCFRSDVTFVLHLAHNSSLTFVFARNCLAFVSPSVAENVFAQVFIWRRSPEAAVSNFGATIRHLWCTFVDPNLCMRSFGGLKHAGSCRSFANDDLVNIIQKATEVIAVAHHARCYPAIFRVVEILGMAQGPQRGARSMNEFRTLHGSKSFADLEDWNQDPKIAGVARQVEATMPLAHGSSICCRCTTMRAIVGGAIHHRCYLRVTPRAQLMNLTQSHFPDAPPPSLHVTAPCDFSGSFLRTAKLAHLRA
ncbi:uncharacterized protein PHACADRAFT_204897 [Phanerochaete carnosa HHB-10118-sp]|uniref:Uncharacterized protein n=1 Tax=Phanerochaete carnosa (strain HHB-10118-sp) TaxID=650164 RepID=K5XF72_PHACS|nr:uncharacterized protein PHACADRAFT_204897 [Phanerochaete carnosa HHB-10118-sp]EKM61737.1 hypothetical protein PHACADRAFT_204897 [Phanerochaete carnosa HHB-10118-sp]